MSKRRNPIPQNAVEYRDLYTGGMVCKMDAGHDYDYTIYSYGTLVAAVKDDVFHWLWNGNSVRTRGHITQALKWAGYLPLTKCDADNIAYLGTMPLVRE